MDLSSENGKSVYVCGPLTELDADKREKVKRFYERIADLVGEVTGIRAFVPHEHYDPVEHSSFIPSQVDEAERHQVCERTSCLIVIAVAPSWGGGIEVEMAYRSNVPVILLCEKRKLEQGRISRLLRGNPGVIAIIKYRKREEALIQLKQKLKEILVLQT